MRCRIETSSEYSGTVVGELPAEHLQRLERLFDGDGQRLRVCLQGMTGEGPTAFRVNGLLSSWDQVRDELAQVGIGPDPLNGVDGVWTVSSHAHRALTDTSAAREGRIYLMTPSSVLPGLALAPQPGEEILDLAAAPGGKTLHLAELMKNQGRIAAVEAVKSRFYQLRRNLERCGVGIVDTYLTDGRGVWRKVPERFDRVLLDAPCSAEGRIVVGEPDSWKYWNLRKIKEMARKQRRLAESAVHCLKPGGIFVYSTCTLAPEENEAIIDRLLRRFSGALEILDLPLDASIPGEPGRTTWEKKSYDEALSQTRRIVPSPPWEGFFLARLRKTASTVPA